MQVKCGTDIIEICRIKQSIEEMGEHFKNRIYTKQEIEFCESKKKQKFQHYAARFAAKEATFKAISQLLDNKFDISFNQIEVFNDSNGGPYIRINDFEFKEIKSIDISLSHCREYAIANVVVLM